MLTVRPRVLARLAGQLEPGALPGVPSLAAPTHHLGGDGGAAASPAREAIQQGRTAWGEKNAVGVSLKPNGYLEYTRGPNKGRAVHVVAMEERIGRRLLADEVVHHIDGDTSNNQINNLALMTRSGHTRLHRREQRIGGQ